MIREIALALMLPRLARIVPWRWWSWPLRRWSDRLPRYPDVRVDGLVRVVVGPDCEVWIWMMDGKLYDTEVFIFPECDPRKRDRILAEKLADYLRASHDAPRC